MNAVLHAPAVKPKTDPDSLPRLAIVLSHPIQYYAPWFREIVASGAATLRVFYLWNPDTTGNLDRSFGRRVKWDIPLLDGYDHEFVMNVSDRPGTHHFNGLNNPDLIDRLDAWTPDAILLFGYSWHSHLRLLLSRRLRRIPVLFRGDSHRLCPATGPRDRLANQFRRLLFRRVSGFLSVGTAHDDYLRAAGVPEERLFRCPHAVDNARFRASLTGAEPDAATWKAGLGLSPDRPVALFAGKFEPKKRPLDLLDAFLSLDLNAFDGRPALLFVGNGELEKELRQRAAGTTGSDVFFAPFQNQTRMPRTYAAGDVLVLPSQGRGETWGLAVNECMNLARPAVVSDQVGCAADLVIPGETGWRFPAGDLSALQSCLEDVFSNRQQTRKMGQAAAARIQHFSYEHATRGLQQALDTLPRQGK